MKNISFLKNKYVLSGNWECKKKFFLKGWETFEFFLRVENQTWNLDGRIEFLVEK